jgi:glutamate dehydrogenase (NAD(P)+)
MDTYSVAVGHTVPGVVTGKPVSLGGSLGRALATSRGVAHVATLAMRTRGIDPTRATAAVQGFGKVGHGAVQLLAEHGVSVVAVSDVDGAIYAPGGLDVVALTAHAARTGSVRDFAGSENIDPADLLALDVDVLVPAAIEGVLTADTAPVVKATIVVEGANGPTTKAGDEILAERDILVVPDILANAGGVVVSYFEWVQANQAWQWSEDDVNARLGDKMDKAWHDVSGYSVEHAMTLRQAATALAVRRVTDAHKLRGLYP